MRANNKIRTGRMMRNVFIASFILPTLLLYLVFTVYPMFKGIYLSLFDWSGGSENYNFIGLGNFKELFKDEIIPKAIRNDYILLFGKILGFMVLSLYFAVVLTRFKVKGSTFFRTVFFFPNVLSVVVVGVLWRYVYNPNLGFLNSVISLFTGKPYDFAWLGDKWAIFALLPPAIWAGVGFSIILLIAGILAIPESLFEAAELDGASQWQQFWNVSLPLMWEQVQTAVLWITMATLSGSFVIVRIMTFEGGTDNATQVLGSYLYFNAFKYGKFSYGSAIGVLILILALITTLGLQRLMKRETIELT
ncbi:carbohydrate ABC transporter permease [Paenibacillus eucommiae]|uniref:N-acetylglucosamine transport system permease protein n=1 Tax=Paenibacillus eucommiae TaxID=1355755 RepID=A0ABS4ILP8_9BACL|nr:sugar ABC transporter permease [Paenibacillus eucommiae]MBP1988438.1 N-acetylglucosamine transport system permease protein [Paenibacillus eucommiae]